MGCIAESGGGRESRYVERLRLLVLVLIALHVDDESDEYTLKVSESVEWG